MKSPPQKVSPYASAENVRVRAGIGSEGYAIRQTIPDFFQITFSIMVCIQTDPL